MESSNGPAKKPAARSGGKSADKSPARAQVNNIKAEELLGRIIEIVRSQGLAGFSLDNLAPQLGTSSRMLVYYFGSKDELLGRIVHELRDEHVATMANSEGDTIIEAIDKWWAHYRANLTDMQFFFHLATRSFEEPDKFKEFSSTAVDLWAAYFYRCVRPQVRTDAEARAIARLSLATVRGLTVDLLITQDVEHVEQSLKAFKTLLRKVYPQTAKTRKR
jgi:AcrR family transcriptional regulator